MPDKKENSRVVIGGPLSIVDSRLVKPLEDDDKMVSDLGDDEIKEITRILAADEGDQHAVAMRLALARAIPELLGHRAARAADKERIRAGVVRAVVDTLNDYAPAVDDRAENAAATMRVGYVIAERAAESLATAWPPPDGRVALHPSLATDKSDPTLRAIVAEKVRDAAKFEAGECEPSQYIEGWNDAMERSVTGATASEVLRRAEVDPA
jgi:hypothetical protein